LLNIGSIPGHSAGYKFPTIDIKSPTGILKLPTANPELHFAKSKSGDGIPELPDGTPKLGFGKWKLGSGKPKSGDGTPGLTFGTPKLGDAKLGLEVGIGRLPTGPLHRMTRFSKERH